MSDFDSREAMIVVPGHRLDLEVGNNSAFGSCPCDWSEFGATEHEVRMKYYQHIRDVFGVQEIQT